jgi:hypothetical protein
MQASHSTLQELPTWLRPGPSHWPQQLSSVALQSRLVMLKVGATAAHKDPTETRVSTSPSSLLVLR